MRTDAVPPALDVLLLGEANPDLVLRGDVVPRFGQSEQLLDGAEFELGGSGAITAHALARLRLRVGLLAAVGADPLGDIVVSLLHQGGLDTAHLQVLAVPTGLSVILSVDPTRRTTFTHIGAIDAPAPAWRTPADLPAARHLHVSSFYLQRRRAQQLGTLLALAHAAGMTTSLDTNLDPAGRFAGLTDVLPHTDVLLPNRAEALAIAATLTSREMTEPQEAARAIAAHGPTVVVKDGEHGALLCRGETVLREPGMPVDAVDATGAGDTFNAGFLAAMLAGRPDADCLRWACAAGALSTRFAGGVRGQPTREELHAATRIQH